MGLGKKKKKKKKTKGKKMGPKGNEREARAAGGRTHL
jgi:hypothetical protein